MTLLYRVTLAEARDAANYRFWCAAFSTIGRARVVWVSRRSGTVWLMRWPW